MASPFFSSYWNQPSESRYSPSSVPLKRKPETASPKVISIPVHFVGSENNRIYTGLSRSDSAVMIQKVFRGFLLRKSVDKIVSIKNQVEGIERRIAQNETVELIRKDSKERLRINETLMALLFKLDSVRGIDSGVRDLRKGVIRKAIALQERVDDLVMHPGESPAENVAAVESGDLVKSDAGEIVDDLPICGDEILIENNSPAAVSVDEMPIENAADSIKSEGGELVDNYPICGDDEVPVENSPAAVTIDEMAIEDVDHSKDDQDEGNCVVKEIVEDCNTMSSKIGLQKQDEEMDDCSKGAQQQEAEEEMETGEVTRENGEKMISEEAGEKKRNEELQTQMIRMMSELVEKNETQMRMINSLTHRVGQLEKAFLCDKLRRSNKKKKRQHDASADEKQR